MAGAKVGIVIGEGGVSSVALLADDPADRETAFNLYGVVRSEVAAFDRRLKDLLGVRGAACRAESNGGHRVTT
jgi:hypothetical protein